MADPVTDYLAAIGRRGGQAKSTAKSMAAAANGRKGGRPPKKRRPLTHNNEGQRRE